MYSAAVDDAGGGLPWHWTDQGGVALRGGTQRTPVSQDHDEEVVTRAPRSDVELPAEWATAVLLRNIQLM